MNRSDLKKIAIILIAVATNSGPLCVSGDESRRLNPAKTIDESIAAAADLPARQKTFDELWKALDKEVDWKVLGVGRIRTLDQNGRIIWYQAVIPEIDFIVVESMKLRSWDEIAKFSKINRREVLFRLQAIWKEKRINGGNVDENIPIALIPVIALEVSDQRKKIEALVSNPVIMRDYLSNHAKIDEMFEEAIERF